VVLERRGREGRGRDAKETEQAQTRQSKEAMSLNLLFDRLRCVSCLQATGKRSSVDVRRLSASSSWDHKGNNKRTRGHLSQLGKHWQVLQSRQPNTIKPKALKRREFLSQPAVLKIPTTWEMIKCKFDQLECETEPAFKRGIADGRGNNAIECTQTSLGSRSPSSSSMR
jgi:hypothetical protein